MAQVIFKLLTRAQYDALSSYDNGTLYRVQETGGGESFYQGTNKLDRNDLDVSDFALASISEGVITLKGLKETDGVIASSSDTTKDVVFAKVASTGTAADVAVVDSGSLLSSTNVEDALAELASASAGGVASKTIWGHDESSGQSDYAKVYKIYQGENDYVADRTDGKTNPTLKLTINIPKDKVLEDSSIVDITFSNNKLWDGLTDVTTLIKGSDTPTAADAGKYLKMVMQNVTDPLYVNLQTFVDVYTVESSASQIQLAINDHEISGSIVAGSVGATELDSTVNASLALADTAVQSVTASDPTTGTNGTITVDGNEVAVKGLGSAAFTDSSAYEEAGAASALAATLASIATSGDSADASYDNTDSGLTSTNVQDALDEIAGTAGSAIQSVTEGSTNGTIAVDGTDVSVHGLGSAAYENTSAFDTSGSAAAVLGTSSDTSSDHTVYGSFAYADAQIASALEWQTVSAE